MRVKLVLTASLNSVMIRSDSNLASVLMTGHRGETWAL